MRPADGRRPLAAPPTCDTLPTAVVYPSADADGRARRAMIGCMADLSRGANAPLTTGPVTVSVAGARQGSVDLMVFQLGDDHKVRSDADFVFFNQPASPEGSVRLVDADRITADLAAVPAAVETLAVAVALDDALPGSLAGIAGLGVTVTGGEVHQAPATGLSTERAAVLVEIYRRAGAWKVRNLSAGWSAGLSALVTAHGVSVDDEPAAPAADPAVADPVVALPPAVLPAGAPYPSASASAPAPAPYPPAPAPYPPAAVPAPYPSAAAPAVAVPVSGVQDPSRNPLPAGLPMPGGFPPPGGSLPPQPYFEPPAPGGWRPPGGPLTGSP